MNCPSRTDEILENDGWNQNPPSFAGDLTTRADLNGITNLRLHRHHMPLDETTQAEMIKKMSNDAMNKEPSTTVLSRLDRDRTFSSQVRGGSQVHPPKKAYTFESMSPRELKRLARWYWQIFLKFTKFIGPGFMVAVAYIDPGNYATDVSAGAATKFKLLFIVFMSNFFAVVLQTLAVRLGSITGMDLAQNCRAHLPRWLNLFLYILAEAAIIATDIAEVIGSAIALNLLLKIPLVAGCALTMIDVLIILLFYSPTGSMRRLRVFELFIVGLVLGVVICFCIMLSLIPKTPVNEVFQGYLPSSAVIQGNGLYLSCGILGATVMPHGLYLGSGVVQSRLRDFDVSIGNRTTSQSTSSQDEKEAYIPSLAAIKSCLSYSLVELVLTLCIFALFVNSAILIVAGAALSSTEGADSADLFGIHNLLSTTMAPIAGTIFALALLLSGTSAGIVATIAGQLVSEGAIKWTISPWLRRLITRSISITPSIIIAGAVGRAGLSAALNGTQVALSVVLPFTSAPLIYFTCRNKYMTVHALEAREGEEANGGAPELKMRNHKALSILAVVIWLVITVMNVALLVLLGLGKA